MPKRRGEGRHHSHLVAGRTPPDRRGGIVPGLPQALPCRLREGRRARLYRRQTGRARRAPSPLRRQPVRRGAEYQGRPRRPARPADVVLAGALRVQRADHGGDRRARCAGRLDHHRYRGQARAPVLGVSVDRAVPPALRGRAGGGSADVRPAAGGRGPHGLHAAWPPGRGGALHAPLFPDGARGGPADTGAGTGDRACRARTAGDHSPDRQGAGGGRLRAGRRQAADHARSGFHRRSDADAAHPDRGARSRIGSAPAGDPRADPQRTPRHRPARRSAGRRAVHGSAVRPQRRARRRSALAVHPERDRFPRSLPARLGADRRSDAVRHLSCLHRR